MLTYLLAFAIQHPRGIEAGGTLRAEWQAVRLPRVSCSRPWPA